ncbi:hypothetical protein ABE10_10535, partial [Bacillus toyonensis]|nr:hypothetical protein [Bacillus toyonensis]
MRDARKHGFEPIHPIRRPDPGTSAIASPSSLVEDATDLLQARMDVTLGAELLGRVVTTAPQLLRKVLLRDDARLGVVRIDIPLPVAQPLGTGVMGVAQMDGDPTESPRPHVCDRG